VEEISQKDFSPLLRPENFHPIPPNTIPAPFLYSPNAPSQDTPLSHLLKSGHFYAAALKSAQELTSLTPPYDARHIFNLLHTRLSCLELTNQTPLAAAESKVLGDLSNAFYRDPLTGAHIVPWDLRVLLVRLQALGFGDWRRGVMAYYALASEARLEFGRAGQEGRTQDLELWRGRLRDLGIRVANALIEMDDVESAGRHLRSLELEGDGDAEGRGKVMMMEALVWLRLGDLRAARRCVARLKGTTTDAASSLDELATGGESGEEDDVSFRTLSALLHIAAGDFSAAVSEWRALHDQSPSDATIQQNLAVCLIYTGHMSEAKELLETLVDADTTPAFQALLFNLCTVYELCTGRANEAKSRLVERVAAKSPSESGWEKASTEFKL
jgi:hypothetical protein